MEKVKYENIYFLRYIGMGIVMRKIYILVLILCLFCLSVTAFSASKKPRIKKDKIEIQKKYRIFIPSFSIHKSAGKHVFFGVSIPKSLRAVLRKKHKVTYKKEYPGEDKLLEQGFELVVRGWLMVKNGLFVVEFFVINLRTKSVIVLADATGYADRRIFNLIDTIALNISTILKQPMGKLRNNPRIVSITKRGKLTKKQLKGSDLSSRNLRNIRFTHMDVSKVNFTKTNLQNSSLKDSNLRRTNFTRANLKGANLTYSDLSFAKFILADLRGVRFDNAVIYKADFTGAKMDFIGDVNIGFLGLNGAFGWFAAQGRLYKNIHIGARIGYSYDSDNEYHDLPVILTFTFNFFDKSTFSNPSIRPYIGIGLGYSFALTKDGENRFISTVFAGAEFFMASSVSLLVETGVVYNQVKLKPTVGAGLNFYLPSPKTNDPNKKLIISTVTRIVKDKKGETNAKNRKEAVKQDSLFTFFGVKMSVGVSSMLQTADTDISDNLSMGLKISYTFGARWFYFKKTIGFILDLEYVNVGGSQNTDAIQGTTHVSFVSVNAMFGLKFSRFYLGLGVYGGIPVGAEVIYTKPENEVDVYEMYKRVDFGGIFSTGYFFVFDRFKMFVGVDFRMSILNAYRELGTVSAPENYTIRHWTVLATFGFGM